MSGTPISAPQATVRVGGWILVAAQFALIILLDALPEGDDWSVPGWLRGPGAVAESTGYLVIAAGAIQLGTRLRLHPAPPRRSVLRTTGVYRFVRHPIYAGVFVFSAAIAATGGTVTHVITWASLVCVLLAKAQLEERLLASRFPGYARYAESTGRFVPRFERGSRRRGQSRR